MCRQVRLLQQNAAAASTCLIDSHAHHFMEAISPVLPPIDHYKTGEIPISHLILNPYHFQELHGFYVFQMCWIFGPSQFPWMTVFSSVPTKEYFFCRRWPPQLGHFQTNAKKEHQGSIHRQGPQGRRKQCRASKSMVAPNGETKYC